MLFRLVCSVSFPTHSAVSQAACENVPNQKNVIFTVKFPCVTARHLNRREFDACILLTKPLIERVALLLLIF